MKKVLITTLILCLILSLLPAAAAGAPFMDSTYGNFTYIDTGENIIITGYNGSGGTVNIPDTINGKPITGISNYVFLQRKSVTGIHIPSTVTSIGYQAFWESGLTSVALPDACTRLEEGAFAGCAKLGAFSVGTGNTAFSCADGVLLSKDQKKLVQYPAGKSIKSYTVPGGVTEIGVWAFYTCSKLTSLYLPNGLTTIDKSAFSGCNWVGSMSIPEGVTDIPDYAFSGCHSLKTISLPSSITSIGQSAFLDCIRLTSIDIPDNVTNLGKNALMGCWDLVTIRIGSGLSSIDDLSAIMAGSGLKEITVDPDNAAYMSENGVLYNKSKTDLMKYPAGKTETSFTVPDGVTKIDKNAFCNCWRLSETITLPDSVTDIGESAFAVCYQTKHIYLGSGVRNIGEDAFGACRGLLEITLPEGVTSIPDDAFAGCTSLTNVTFPDSVTSIGKAAFTECVRIAAFQTGAGNTAFCSEGGILFSKDKTKLVLYPAAKDSATYSVPAGVTRIEPFAFAFCLLSSVMIPDSVTSIGQCAFLESPNMVEVTIGSGVTTMEANAFDTYRIEAAYFLGDAPAMADEVFSAAHTNLTVYYMEGKDGFDNPWHGLSTKTFDPSVSYNITFNVNGSAGGAPAARTYYKGVKILKPEDPTWSNHFFGGWYREPACTTRWNFSTDIPASDTILYAKWSQTPSVKLATLIVTPGKWNKLFSPDKSSYTITLGEDDKKATITPTKAYDGAKLTIDGEEIWSKDVQVANNKSVPVKIKITYGRQSKVYTLIIKRDASTNSALKTLDATVPGLDPVFTPGHFDYTLNLDEYTDRVRLTAEAASPLAKVYYPDRTYLLKNNQTKIVTIRVRCQKGTSSYYHVKITRAPSSNADLDSIKTSPRGCIIDPGFKTATTDYTITMPANLKTMIISSKPADRLSKVVTTVTINGVSKKTNRVTLLKGQSAVVTVTVTAQDKKTIKVYHITVSRPAI